MSLLPSTRLGPYEILSLVGAGGMGEVYKATDTRLGRTVAVKILTSKSAANPNLRERFDREARAISRLDHPHICALYDVGVHDGMAYLVMQYLSGETLADRVRRGPVPLDCALRSVVEVLDGLAAAHRAGITHRDLKPANIMLTKSGAKLLDFGLAKLRTPCIGAYASGATTGTEEMPLTAAGMIVGTLHYISPEQLEGHDGDARSDIFAVGAILFETVTGKKAFDGKSPASVIAAILERDVRVSNDSILPSAGLNRLVRKCLAKDPDERWQTAKDLGDELRWLLQSEVTLPTANSQVEGEQQTTALQTRGNRRRRFIFRFTIGISLSVFVALGLSGVIGFRHAQSPISPPDIPIARGEPTTSPATPLADQDPSVPAVVDPDTVRTRLAAAHALVAQRNYSGARSNLERVLAIDPGNAQAKELMAQIATDARVARAILAVIEAYRGAYSALDYSALIKVWPKPPRDIRNVFQEQSRQCTQYNVTLDQPVVALDTDGNTATVTTGGTYACQTKVGGKPVSQQTKEVFHLRRTDTGWLIEKRVLIEAR